MLGTILLFILLLSILVIAHEWGHFTAARKAGMRVDEFAIGFPPRLFGRRDKNGTLWAFNLIPLGGYVKIHGESGEGQGESDSFASKSFGARLLVLAAGVIMNLVLAAVLFGIGFAVGLPVVSEGDTPAALSLRDTSVTVLETLGESELKFGDRILAADEESVSSSQDLQNYLASRASENAEVEFTINRAGEELSVASSPQQLEGYEDPVYGLALAEAGIGTYPWYLIPFKAIEATINYTILVVVAFGALIWQLISGGGVPAGIAGPVGIATMTGDMASLGIGYLIQFAAVLSINLAVLNILPFPALDGGRILFLFIEKLKGSPVSPKTEAIIHNTGFLLLLALIVLITYRDIVQL
jgi:regulator of sigma E protease